MAEVKVQGYEVGLRDVVNVGLGLFNSVAAKVDEIQKNLLKGYQDLVVRGASDKSSLAQTLRGGLDQGITTVKGVQGQFDTLLGKRPVVAAVAAPAPKAKASKQA